MYLFVGDNTSNTLHDPILRDLLKRVEVLEDNLLKRVKVLEEKVEFWQEILWQGLHLPRVHLHTYKVGSFQIERRRFQNQHST
jgi:hypothetical protein